MTDDLFADPIADNLTSTVEVVDARCPNCMEMHSHCREGAAALIRETIRRELDNRLARVEYLLSEMHEGDRVALARWIQGVLERPPLSNTRARTLEPMRAFLDAMWRDIYEMTPDPLRIEADDGSWAIERPHHELAEMREADAA